jgi:hypothetical protein
MSDTINWTRPNEMLMPSYTGWVYDDPSGARIQGRDHDSLVAATEAYRRRNKLEVGNVLRDVEVWLCEHNAGFCPKASTSSANAPSTHTPGGDKIASWVGQIARMGPDRLVSNADPVVLARVKVCVGCPMNDRFLDAKCGGCTQAARKVEDALGHFDKGLRHCDLFLWSNKLAVRLPDVTPDHTAPWHCWRNPLNFQTAGRAQ